MYASVSSVQIQPGQVAALTQLWSESIEPAINQLSSLVDLYVLVNEATHTELVIAVYASAADALACQEGEVYQQLFAQVAHLLIMETVIHTGYTVIST